MQTDEWGSKAANAIEEAKSRLYKDLELLSSNFIWKEEDVQSYLFHLLLGLEPFRSEIDRGRLSIHREYFTKSHYRRGKGGSVEKLATGTNKQRGMFDLVVIHPENAGYSAEHPVLHAIEIKYPREFLSGFSRVWLEDLTGEIYADYLKLTDPENGIGSKENRHLICILGRERLPRQLSLEDVIRPIEDHPDFRGQIDLRDLRFSLIVFDSRGKPLGPIKNY